MRNFKTNSKNFLDNKRKTKYKVISLASLSAFIFTLSTNEHEHKEVNALMGKGGTVKFYGSNGGSKVVRPGNMGSTGVSSKVNYPTTSAKPATPKHPVTNPQKTYTSSLHIQVGGNSTRPSTSRPTAPTSTTVKPPTTTTVKPPTSSAPSMSGSDKTSLSGRRPSTSGSVGGSSIGNTDSLYDDVISNNSSTSSKNGKLTKNQKVAIIAGSTGLGLGALAAIGVGVGVSEADKDRDKNTLNKVKGPVPVPTPEAPKNSSDVLPSAQGNFYIDSRS